MSASSTLRATLMSFWTMKSRNNGSQEDPQWSISAATSTRFGVQHLPQFAKSASQLGSSNRLQLNVAAWNCFRAAGMPLARFEPKSILLFAAIYALCHNRRLRCGVFCVSVSHGGSCCPRSSRYCSVVASPRCEPTEGLTLHEGFVQAITHSR